MICRKRKSPSDNHLDDSVHQSVEIPCVIDNCEPAQVRDANPSASDIQTMLTTRVTVNCRGTTFETLALTLQRFGECYLSMQTQIGTPEEIYLDFSPSAFQILLDALTLAQRDLARALLHLAQKQNTACDLNVLLHFLGIDWALGVRLPLPPSPPLGTPRSERTYHDILGPAYHLESGVFHHLARQACQTVRRKDFRKAILPLPCCFESYDLDLPLKPNEMYEDVVQTPKPGCIPVSLETYDFYLINEDDADDTYGERVCAAIHMLSLEGDLRGNRLDMYAGSAAVLDLGPRRALCCDGIVIKVFRSHDADSMLSSHDLLTVEVVSELDRDGSTVKLVCQHLDLVPGCATFCRVEVPSELRRFARILRLKLDPFQSEKDESDWHEHEASEKRPLYRLDQVELFGHLVEVPAELLPQTQLLPPFAMDRDEEPEVLHVRMRRKRRIGERR